MPPISSSKRIIPDGQGARGPEDSLHDFYSGFRRSSKGNLWRYYKIGDTKITLTVFGRPELGTFSWCIATPNGPSYSPCNFDSEDDALEALAAEVVDGLD